MISIHQSQFLPWLPYFYKIMNSQTFVVLDDVQFQKNGVQNRNKIKTPQGVRWLTVPVKLNFGELINQVQISSPQDLPKLLKTLELNYKKSRFFKKVYAWLEKVLSNQWAKLNQLNRELLKNILNSLDLKTKVVFSSDMKLNGKKQDLVIEIIKKSKDRDYLSGKGALDYMDLDRFKKEGIGVYTYDFNYTDYNQLWNSSQGFIPELSIIDLMFNDLELAADYIHNNGAVKRII